ncbi:hypothetical protein SELMODRAFT_271184 [Selaginella moellendorffii]|uniref:Uncharacterized protein ycf23 n=1 Tax=Selaginella moellendorffii TaxID=88036 RepID=D8RYP1_SELML|nr:uncharacterized protein ycf23 isoform X2 [Selaginella moellendorffii]EFJ22466.1 hypothetical protein SELMODRAFT_271184 [Selaginella moellendorffii]|eukprot:XP_002976206.1 uncharacterized protein ycf23 isoform X2 [Selaginella moellendorffii]
MATSLLAHKSGVFFGSASALCDFQARPALRSSRRGTVRASSRSAGGECRDFALRDVFAKRAFKVIAGLNNFDRENVADVVVAAEKGGATHVDIACDPQVVELALGLTSLPICVSAVDPEAFVAAVDAGAHMIEIGNFDSFYDSGRVFSSKEVLELTRRTRELLPHITLSVTVPHTLPLDEQVQLAEALEEEGADIIQTEGGTASTPSKPGITGLIEKATPTLAAAYSISRAITLPVLCASGLSAVTAPMAITAGASGVGIGSAVNKLNSQLAMVATVRSIADAMGLEPSTEKIPERARDKA